MQKLYYIVDISNQPNIIVVDDLTWPEVMNWFNLYGDIVIHEVKEKNPEN